MENPESKFLSDESASHSRQLHEKAIKQEAAAFNKDFNWSNYEQALEEGKFSMVALLELFKRGVLKPEDIVRIDAERVNELKSKKGLNEQEKEELDLRERGDLFYDRRLKKYPAVNFWGMISSQEEGGGIYKDIDYVSESIMGFLDGEEVALERIEYHIDQASLDELKRQDPKQAKLFERVVYAGKIGQRDLNGDEAKKLLTTLSPFAKKRSAEIKNFINSVKESTQ